MFTIERIERMPTKISYPACLSSLPFVVLVVPVVRMVEAEIRPAPSRYCLAMAMRRRSSGSMKWSWSSSPRSIWTQLILPVNRLPWAV